jgi:hypothetical protein
MESGDEGDADEDEEIGDFGDGGRRLGRRKKELPETRQTTLLPPGEGAAKRRMRVTSNDRRHRFLFGVRSCGA